MDIERIKTELTANQGEFRKAQSTMQIAGDEVEIIGEVPNIHAMSARN